MDDMVWAKEIGVVCRRTHASLWGCSRQQPALQNTGLLGLFVDIHTSSARAVLRVGAERARRRLRQRRRVHHGARGADAGAVGATANGGAAGFRRCSIH